MQPASDSIAERIGDTHRIGGRSVAALSLIAANTLLLLIYLAFDLTLFQIVVVYWWEALWVGLFSGLKLMTASVFGSPYENRWIGVSRGASFLMSLFVIVKAGGAFLFSLMLTGVALVVAYQELTGTDGSEFVREQGGLILRCSLIFLLSHGVSFVINFLFLGEFRRAKFTTLLWLPFKRSIALFVAIAASVTAIQAYPGILNSTTYAAILIAIKLSWDYVLHRRERFSFTVAGARKEPQ
ncbi:MAG: DUF6498-containing protein [Woeseiaceae bacterium]